MIAIEFGSKHNGFASTFSDNDLLLIHENPIDFIETKKAYDKLGYDVTSMHTDKAAYLCNSGSLFMKHIIDQGLVISGDERKYKQVFDSWKARHNYHTEIESNIDLLDLLNYLPPNNYSLLFANDLIIISVRNIIIRRLAELGIYAFSWEVIFDISVKLDWLNENDTKVLLISRRIKNRYRNNFYVNISIAFFENLFNIAKKVMKYNGAWGFCNKKKTIISLPELYKERSYKQLRAIEIICAYYGFSNEVSQFKEMVKSPNYFSGNR